MNPLVTVINVNDGTSITREMTDEEYALLLDEQATATPPIETPSNE